MPVFILVLTACAPPDPPIPPDVTTPEPSPDLTVSWETCDLGAPGDGRAECTHIPVPLDHTVDGGPTTSIFVKRVPSLEAGSTTALWYLAGGPGALGSESLAGLDWLQVYIPDLTIYAIDHRGVGGSERLACPDEQAFDSPGGWTVLREERDGCAETLGQRPELPYITVEQASADVAYIIEAVRETDQRQVLRGGSYGTFWAHRVLERYPTLVDAALLTAVVPPDTHFAAFDQHMDRTGRDWLAECETDPECPLAADPAVLAQAALEGLEDGTHCPDLGVPASFLRAIAGEVLMHAQLRTALLPLYARLVRCDEADQEALRWLANNVFGLGQPSPPVPFDWPTFWHITSSEMWPENGPDTLTLDEDLLGMVTATGRGADIGWFAETWPIAARAPDANLVSPAQIPVLLLHGGRDPTMAEGPVRAYAAALGSEARLVLFPDAPHNVLGATPVEGGGDCAARLEVDFIRDPNAPLHDCPDEVLPPSLVPTPELSQALFGDPAPWGGVQ